MTIGLVALALLLLLCFFGIRIGFATLLVGVCGIAMLRGWSPAFTMLMQQVLEEGKNYNLSVIPMFIAMGVFIYRSDVSKDLFDAAYMSLGKFRGGLAHSTILACAGFSAVCGSSVATAATMSKVAMTPMRQYKYDDGFAAGTIAAGGTLGIMIPPSVPLVIYGVIAEQDVGLLFMAGVLPGLLLVALFLLTIVVLMRLRPSLAPMDEKIQIEDRRKVTRAVIPILGLFVLVLGGIYLNLFTPTEAAGIGAFGSAIIAILRGRLRTFREWRDALVETGKTSSALFIVIFGALVFAQFINLSGMPQELLTAVKGLALGPMGLVGVIIIIALLMGMVFEAIGIILLLIPIFLPSLQASNIDMIWFGIIVVLVTELGLITPPVGMNVFVVKSVVDNISLNSIFRGVTPFIFAMLIGLALILVFPPIATLLPTMMK